MTEHEEEVEHTDSFAGATGARVGRGVSFPGGKGEIALFLEDLDISGKAVLGCDVVLIRDYGAAHVHGIDVWHAGMRAAEVGELPPGHLRAFKPAE